MANKPDIPTDRGNKTCLIIDITVPAGRCKLQRSRENNHIQRSSNRNTENAGSEGIGDSKLSKYSLRTFQK